MSQTLAAPRPAMTRWAQYYALTKPRVVQLIVFCALIGVLLAQPGLPDWRLAGAAVMVGLLTSLWARTRAGGDRRAT